MCQPNADSNGDGNSYSDGYGDGYVYSYSDGYGYGYSYSYGHANSDGNGPAEACSNAETASNAAAAPIVRNVFGGNSRDKLASSPPEARNRLLPPARRSFSEGRSVELGRRQCASRSRPKDIRRLSRVAQRVEESPMSDGPPEAQRIRRGEPVAAPQGWFG